MLVNLISSYFDVAPSMSTHLPVTIWRKTVGTLLQLLQLLNEFPNITMDPNYDPEADDVPPLDPNNIDNLAPVKVRAWRLAVPCEETAARERVLMRALRTTV